MCFIMLDSQCRKGGLDLLKRKVTQSELRKEEKEEKSQNHEGDLYLLHCILFFNFLFQYYE